MTKIRSRETQPTVVTGVFENLIQRLLADESVDRSTIERLRVALLEDQEYSVDKLRQALFSEDFPL